MKKFIACIILLVIASYGFSQETNDNNNQNQLEKPVFRVQILTSDVLLPDDSPKFKDLIGVDYYIHNGTYKYTWGETTMLSRAEDLLEMAKESGFKDAFIVAFYNKQRITLEEAEKMLNK